MKMYVLVASVVLMTGGCVDSNPKKDPNLDVPAVCSKRSEIEMKHEKFASMFLSCVNSPRRVATATDDESDIIEECRIASSRAYGTSLDEDIFLQDTAHYATDCKTNGDPR